MLAPNLGTVGLQLRLSEVEPGITGLNLATVATRYMGMESSCFLVGDILVDTSFVHAAPAVQRYLADKPIAVIACTHHHEDHVGSCGALQRERGCPVFMRRHHLIKSEGLIDLAPYRRLWWGVPPLYTPEELPATVSSGGTTLTAVPTPGHSQTQVALLEERTGVAFVGDLFISGGVTAVMPQENPYQIVESLRRVADLEPRWLLNGHGLQMEQPAGALRKKAERIERATEQVRELAARGIEARAIVRQIFTYGHTKDRILGVTTSGEFSRINFVHACLTHAPAAPAEATSLRMVRS